MTLKKECLSYLEFKKIKLIEEYTKYKLITAELFVYMTRGVKGFLLSENSLEF